MKTDHFHCKYLFTAKCIDPNNKDCNRCSFKMCNSCENSWSSNTCSECKYHDSK